jgi:hypothetical protein
MYDKLKNIPSSRDGKMAYGIFAALIARASLNSGIDLLSTNADGSLFAFLTTGVLLYTIGLAIVRFDTNRPLFEPLKQNR